MFADDTATEEDAQDDGANVAVHRRVWQFAKMVTVLGLVIGAIFLVTKLPSIGQKATKIDSDSLAEKYTTATCSIYQGVGHTSISEACCAASCGEKCGTTDCQNGDGGYKACCASFFKTIYCGNGQMAPCMVTTTTTTTTTSTTTTSTTTTTTTTIPNEVMTGRLVVSTASHEGALAASSGGGTDHLACRQAITVALGLSPAGVKVKQVSVRSSGNSWSGSGVGGGMFVIDYEITALKGSAVFQTLADPPSTLGDTMKVQLQQAFTDVNINTVVTRVTFPKPITSVV